MEEETVICNGPAPFKRVRACPKAAPTQCTNDWPNGDRIVFALALVVGPRWPILQRVVDSFYPGRQTDFPVLSNLLKEFLLLLRRVAVDFHHFRDDEDRNDRAASSQNRRRGIVVQPRSANCTRARCNGCTR